MRQLALALTTLLCAMSAGSATATETSLSCYEKALAESVWEMADLLSDFREASPWSYEQADWCDELIDSDYGQDLWRVHRALKDAEEEAAAAERAPGKHDIATAWDWDGKLSIEQAEWLDSWTKAVRFLAESLECDPAVTDCEAIEAAMTEQTRQVTVIQEM